MAPQVVGGGLFCLPWWLRGWSLVSDCCLRCWGLNKARRVMKRGLENLLSTLWFLRRFSPLPLL